MSFIHHKLALTQGLLLVLTAFLVRSATFYFYVQHNERYCQADSPDYHICTLCMHNGFGMFRPDLQRPIFWRTPGYPWYLQQFYKQHCITSTQFNAAQAAQKSALWMQIMLCSLLPLLLFWLAFILTHSYPVAWLTSLISLIHLGFVLAPCYLLTDGLAMLFFVVFLIFYYRGFTLFYEKRNNNKLYNFIVAAFALALYTWMRPMGQFVALIATLIVLGAHEKWRTKLIKSALFLILFFASIFPWFVRNYQLTGKWFFCPLFGLYFNVFNAPKILARAENIPLKEAHRQLTQQAGVHTAHVKQEYQQMGKKQYVCGEMVCLETAWPLIKAHPWYFMYDWCVEVCKTTFDLYASQLVAFAKNCFKWDPLVEYLPEKIADCLYQAPLNWFMRFIAWLEFIFSLIVWAGIFGGVCHFLLKPLFSRKYHWSSKTALWLKTGILIGCVVFQTGGFGYARLRLPIEPLMIILGITFWWWVFYEHKQLKHPKII
ncbi:MAG: hypothetical protein WA432_04060 [Candidatus Babeliaceae bacterium]